MKKYLIIASAALVALAACNKEVEIQEPANNTDEVVLTFTSERPQFEAGTKTAWDATNSCIVWESTDKIRVGYTLNGNWMGQDAAGIAKFYASTEVTIDDDTDSSVGTFKVPITGSGVTAFTDPETNGTYKFYSIYPHSILSNTTVNDPTSQSITLATTQTPGANTFDHSTDIMVGVTDNMSITGLPTDPIELNWKRVVAHAALSFTNMGFVGTEIPNKITLTFNEDAKVAGSFSVNITDGTIGAGSANEIILEGSGLTVDGTSINAWATVLPVSFSSLNVEIKTDKATYARSITGLDKTFKGNARNTLKINMEHAGRTASAQYEWVKTDLSAITASDVFVIVGNNGDNYAMSNDKGASSAPEAVAVTVANDNKLTVAPADRLQWTLTKDESNYTFYPNGTTETWLYCTNNNNGLRVGTGSDKVFTITDNYLYNSGQSRYIGIYNSQDWRSYKLGTNNAFPNNIKDQTFAFYVKTAAGPAVTWKLESIAITTQPDKTTYTAGQSFDPAGMVVTGYFVDADDNTNTKEEEVTGYTITPNGALSVSDTQVTITYQGKTATQNITVNAAPAGNDGSLEHPYTASEARTLALNGDTGSYYISGIVTKIQNQYSASYGTANFWIDENGADQTVFEGYKIKYFGNVNWVEGNAEIALDDEVIIYGTLTVYVNNNTPETSSGYLVSLNGKTKGLTLAAPTVTTNDSAKQITVEWTAATGTESSVSYVINCGTQSHNATAAGSHTFTMADYGTYNVSVEATASDAVAATINTSATLTDPSAGTPTEYTIEWGASYNGKSVSSYTDSWDATKDGFTVNMQNFNNNNNGWNYVKCGRKNNASVATIITDAAITEAIKTVTITIDALTAANINSITLYVSSSKTSGWTSAGTFTKATGNQSVTISSPAANKYYKLEFDCASGSSNGLLTLSKAVFSTK